MILKRFFLIKFIVVFFIIYDFSFVAFPSLTSGRIALLIIVYDLLYRRKITISRNIVYFLAILFILLIGSLIQYISSNDFIQSSRLLWFTIYSVITPVFLSKWFKDSKEFLQIFLLATTLQSVIATFSFFNPLVKQNILNIIIVGGNDMEEIIYRAISFSGASGAALSVIQFCGVFSGLILLKSFTHSIKNSALIWICVVVTLLSTLIIGRTGLLCSLLSIIVFSVPQFNFRKLVWFSGIIILVTQINFLTILESQTESISGFNVEFFLNWIEEAFTVKDNHTANVIQEMPIPPLSINTIMGTGEVFNTEKLVNSSGNDSGYIQTYYSLGIIMAIIFYISYFMFLISETKTKNLFSILFFVFLMFIIEFKEPFIFKYILPFFILTLIFLSKNKDEVVQQKLLKKI